MPEPLLFDGAMGTYYLSLPEHTQPEAELASLFQPDLIRSIHEEYMEAGARAIKTNTFSLTRKLAEGQEPLVKALLEASVRVAREASFGSDVRIFASIGPAPAGSSPADLYIRLAGWFLEAGITDFLLETQADLQGLEELALWLQSHSGSHSLIVSFAVGADGISRQGIHGSVLLNQTWQLPGITAAGFNCMSGPHHLLNQVNALDLQGRPLSVMPNAGYPEVTGKTSNYKGSPEYFAYQMKQIAQKGARILGGCCGTTPAHIRALAGLLEQGLESPQPFQPVQPARNPRPQAPSRLWDRMQAGQKVFAVELDPPANDRIAPFLEKISVLVDGGADLITIADCPIGRPRADSSLLACKIQREMGIEVLPHMTCRDRNLNATRALLLGLSMEGVHNLLVVTGDPIPDDARAEVKSVFSFNSRKLAAYISSLDENTLSTPFHLFGALDLNARNFEVQIRLAKEKEQAGIQGFLTQPILSARALENLRRARQELKGKILAGILPIVSYKNALFLENEVSGMKIDEQIIELYNGKNRQEAEDLAVKISLEAAKAAADWCDGWYIMTPFQRANLVCRILKGLQDSSGS